MTWNFRNIFTKKCKNSEIFENKISGFWYNCYIKKHFSTKLAMYNGPILTF